MSRLVFAGILIAGVAVAAAAGQRSTADKMPSLVAPSLAGRDVFAFYCSPCHGRDGTGAGPVAAALKTLPPDSTTLALRNGGTFPRREVEAFVTSGRPDALAHGSAEMPVWGPTFRSLEPSDALVKVRIANVVDYVASIQIARPVPGREPTRTGRLMREKLAHAQRILEALTTSDLALLERESAALARITESPQWEVLKTPEYKGHSTAFLKAARDLAEAARQRDLDAAATHYSAMTMTCYQCHRYLKNTRIAR